MSADIVNLDRGAFVRELLGDRRVRVEPPAPERYDLRTWAHGYAIYDRGDVIATFHGPQFALASRLLRLLREDAPRPGPEAA